jgi:hypothetical protein
MLRLTSGGIASRYGGLQRGFSPSSLMRRADDLLHKELKSVRSAEIVLSSFTFGVLQGRFKSSGGLTMFALPVDLLCGAAFHIFGLMPFARGYSQHLHAFADGALASFFTTTGYRVGERWAAGGSLIKGMSGMFGDVGKEPAGGSSIADKELASLVKAG